MALREPLVLPACALIVGVLIEHFFPGDIASVALAAAGLFVLSAAALYFRARMGAAAAILAGFVAAGCVVEVVHRPGAPPRLDVKDLSVTILDGCVVEPPALTGDREQFTVELAPHVRARVSFLHHAGEPMPDLRYGRLIEAEGLLRTPHNFQNPGAFDFRNYLARQQIYWTLAAHSVHNTPGVCGNAFDGAIANLRAAALDRIATLYGSDRYNTAMMDAVLIGESSGLERVWTEQYRSTGTFHALVISGSHVAVLAAALLFFLRCLFVPRSAAIAMTIGAAWLYALITGWQPPVIRSAAGMTLVAMAGLLFYRSGRLLNTLAAVVTAFLLMDPDSLFDPSFQLSFLAVAFLATFAAPVIDGLQALRAAIRDLGDEKIAADAAVAELRLELRLLKQTVELWTGLGDRGARLTVVAGARCFLFLFPIFWTSLVIQAGLALPMAMYFHRVSMTGLSANILVVPLLGLVVPVGFAALFLNSAWAARAAAFLLGVSQQCVAFHSRFEPNWRIVAPPLWLVLLLAVGIALAAVRWRHKWQRATACACALGLTGLLIAGPFPAQLHPRLMEVSAIDVGQGDSILLVTPDGRTLLTDAGGIPSFARGTAERPAPVRLEIGEDVVAPYLWTRDIRRLDVVAISHLHDDHAAGVPAVLSDFQVGELWVGATPECELWTRIQQIARARGTRIKHLQQGECFRFGLTDVQVLEPTPGYVPEREPHNNDSLVLRVAFEHRSVLLTGDMESPLELAQAAAAGWPHADLLKVGHHGSKTSSTGPFLDQVKPALAIISDGYGNLYGHPHKVTLGSLEARHVLAWRTDRDGEVTVLTDGYKMWRE